MLDGSGHEHHNSVRQREPHIPEQTFLEPDRTSVAAFVLTRIVESALLRTNAWEEPKHCGRHSKSGGCHSFFCGQTEPKMTQVLTKPKTRQVSGV